MNHSPCRAFIVVEGHTRECDRQLNHSGRHEHYLYTQGTATKTRNVEVRMTWSQR